MTADAPATSARLARLFAQMALLAAALTFVVIVASAFMRHAQAGLSCADWPACYAVLAAPGADAAPDPAVHLVRIAHRLAATTVLALVIGLLLIAWTQKPAWRRAGGWAVVALVIAAALALLGIVTPGARIPAVTLGNLVGGYAMLAALVATYATAAPAPPLSGTARSLAAIALALVFVQAALGAMIGAQYASPACPALADCGAWSWREVFTGGALDPLRPLAVRDGRVVAPDGAAGLHVLHRLVAIAVAALVVAGAALARHDRPRWAWTLGGALLLALAFAFAAVSPQPALGLVVAHNAAAALLAALLTAGCTRAPA